MYENDDHDMKKREATSSLCSKYWKFFSLSYPLRER